MSDTVHLTIDDRELDAPKSMNLIEAAKLLEIEVPHYCYHPKLKVVGNCRMCLVEVGLPRRGPDQKVVTGPDGKPVIGFAPKPAIGCNTTVADGMVVRTRSAKIEKARAGVMEFLLINHPLDCPICDQAGECRLQEFAIDYGRGASRFREEKVHQPKAVPLGPKVMLDDERCIECSRCIRFMRDIAGQDCLGFVQRGSYSRLTCYPGQEPNTNYDLNIVDICPVGALTSVDFRFRERVWFLKETRSVCPNCATGCNTLVASRDGEVYRQTPRDNEAVNQCWMCDHGRVHYKYVNDARRLTAPACATKPGSGEQTGLSWDDALTRAAEQLTAARAQGGASIAAIGSARATTEEQYLFARLARKVLGATLVDCAPRTGAGDKFLLKADRNPNTRGAQMMGLAANPPGSGLAAIAEGIRTGRIRTLLVLGDNVTLHGIDAGLLGRLDFLMVIDTLPNGATACAHLVLPGVTFAEKRGTFINAAGRMQRFSASITPQGQALPEWQILGRLLARLGDDAAHGTFEEVFAGMAASAPELNGLNFSKIGDLGVQVAGREAAAHAQGEARV